jgi:putative cell wall-binding protein/Tol biopolymer transport system component
MTAMLGASLAAASLTAGVLGGSGAAFAASPGVGVTAIVSVDAAGILGTAGAPENSVSGDGRYVAFSSGSAFAGVPTAGTSQIFRKDTSTGAITLVSAGRDGAPGNRAATQPSISADGRYVAFVSNATNLDPAHSTGDILQVFVRDLAPGGVSRLVTVNTARSGGGDALSLLPSISGNGGAVVFQSAATNLVPSATTGTQVFRADLTIVGTPAVEVVSVQDPSTSATPMAADSDATAPVTSFDGSVVAFVSAATNLTSDTPAPGVTQVFTHDRRTRATVLVSAAAGAAIAGDRDSMDASISADGRTVAFASKATNLALTPSGTATTMAQVFVRETEKGRASRVVSLNSTGAAPGNSNSAAPTISADGRRVAFASNSTDMTSVPNPDGISQVIVRDLVSGTNSTASVEVGGPVAGTDFSGDPSISADGRFVGFSSLAPRFTVTDAMGRSAVYLRGVFAEAGPIGGSMIERIGGADRYAVSAATSSTKFSAGVPVAFVASGVVFPDALSGSAAAGLGEGPVLLTRKDALPDKVAAELRRLQPGRIVVLGGTATVSPAVQKALEEFVAKDASRVKRIAGVDRYEVSAAVSAATFKDGVDVAYVASGAVFPDALSGSAAAGLRKGPVLLVTKDTVPPSIVAELARLKPKSIVVLGGTSTVADAVVAQLQAKVPNTTRLAGADRYIQSAEVANASFTATGGTVFVASGQVFPDALSGSAAAIRAKAPVLLVAADRIPGEVAAQLTRLKPTRIVVLGGEATVSAAVYEQLRGHLAK